MKTRRRTSVTVILGIAFVAMLWPAFRPELLFVNNHVDDPFPAANATTARATVTK